MLVEEASEVVPDLPTPSELPVVIPEYDTSAESWVTDLFLRVYYESLIAGAQKQRSVYDKWQNRLHKDSWSHKAYAAVGRLGFDHGSFLIGGDPQSPRDLFSPLAECPHFSFPRVGNGGHCKSIPKGVNRNLYRLREPSNNLQGTGD